jgi:hypothetical protein
MRRTLVIAFLLGFAAPASVSVAANEKGCLVCHEGIERFSDGGMQTAINAMARPFKDPGGCVICHGGTPTATKKEIAHAGAMDCR